MQADALAHGARSTQLDQSTTGRHIPALDGVRGLAILLVFALHFFWGNQYSGRNPALWIFAMVRDHGWMGVDLFFVLSGFLITGILYDTRASHHYFRNFYGRRVLRIFPLYYALLLVLLVVSVATGYAWNGAQFLRFATFTDTLLAYPWPGVPAPHSALISLPHLDVNHLWSLMIEEQFYLVWPLAVWLLRTRRKIALAAVVVGLFSLGTRFVLAHSTVVATKPYLLYGFTFSRLDGLAFGALLAMLVRSRWEHRVLRVAGYAFAAGVVIVFSMAHVWPHLDWQTYPMAAVWGFFAIAATFAAMLAWALRKGSLAQRFFNLSVMRFYGRYSYGLYVLHFVFTSMSMQWRLALRARGWPVTAADLLTAMVGIALNTLVAVLVFKGFEQRFLRLKRFFHNDAHRPTLAAVVARDNHA